MIELPWRLFVKTPSGVAGVLSWSATQEEAEAQKTKILHLKEQVPNAMLAFSPIGMGLGAPIPFGAISDVFVLGPGEEPPAEIVEKAMECAGKFWTGLKGIEIPGGARDSVPEGMEFC